MLKRKAMFHPDFKYSLQTLNKNKLSRFVSNEVKNY